VLDPAVEEELGEGGGAFIGPTAGSDVKVG
jgi:hypothetical protein